MKTRKSLFAILAIVLVIVVTACSPRSSLPPVIVGPSNPGGNQGGGGGATADNTFTNDEAQENAPAYLAALNFDKIAKSAAKASSEKEDGIEKAVLEGEKLTVSFSDYDLDGYTIKDGSLLFTFSTVSRSTSYDSYTVSSVANDPLVILKDGETTTHSLAITTATGSCDVSAEGTTITVTSVGTPASIEASLDDHEIDANYTIVEDATSLTEALLNGGEILVTDNISIENGFSIAVDGTTLRGMDGTSITISTATAQTGSVGLISITANSVAIENLDIVYDGSQLNSGNHILKASYATNNTPITGLQIKDVDFNPNGNAAGLNLHGVTATLDNVTVADGLNVSLTITDSTVTVNGGNYDNGEISLGGADYQFADIQINLNILQQ